MVCVTLGIMWLCICSAFHDLALGLVFALPNVFTVVRYPSLSVNNILLSNTINTINGNLQQICCWASLKTWTRSVTSPQNVLRPKRYYKSKSLYYRILGISCPVHFDTNVQ